MSMIDRMIGLNGSSLPNLSGTIRSLRSLLILHLELPRVIPLIWVWNPDTVAPAAKDFAVIFNKVFEASEKAKLSMKLQMDRHWNPASDYKVSQQIWLSTDNLCMLNCASKKLMEKWIGPYEVTQVTPNVVKLKLPKTLRIHPVCV